MGEAWGFDGADRVRIVMSCWLEAITDFSRLVATFPVPPATAILTMVVLRFDARCYQHKRWFCLEQACPSRTSCVFVIGISLAVYFCSAADGMVYDSC